METQPEVLAFVKAMASAERLRVVGVLARGPAAQADVAEQLHIPARDAFGHLSYLLHVGVLTETEGVYDLNEKAVESLARSQLKDSRPQHEEHPENVRKVLKAYLNADGTIKEFPLETKRLVVLLSFIVDVFAFDANYTEKEVNTILRRFHADTAALRRYLVDHNFMAREGDGSRYWRCSEPAKGRVNDGQ